MNITQSKRDDGTLEYKVIVPWDNINKSYKSELAKILPEVEVAGFRKGKAPTDLAEKQIDKNKVYEKVLEKILPEIYQTILTDYKIKPVTSPSIHLHKAKEGEDWEIMVLTCEKPEIHLGNYKEKLKLTGGVKPKIWVPGKDQPQDKTPAEKPSLDSILEVLFDTIKIKLPSILWESEVNKMLSNLVDQTQKVGLSVDQYLKSTGKNIDQIKNEYRESARKTLSLEFALEEIADQEKITVDDQDIDDAISKSKSEEEKQALQKERYYVASVIRRQKTLDFLSKI